MRVGFAGTPDFAVRALAAIAGADHTIPLVLTQPDRPHGRGMRLASSPIKSFAQAQGLPVAQPPSLRDPAGRASVLTIPLDVLVVAAYGLILPPEVLAWPRHGCLNIHASKLPRWRGAAPIQRAIEAGDTVTGITIMQMDAGLDTGPVIGVREVAIADDDTAATLTPKLAAVGADAILATLAALAREGRLTSLPQAADGVTYAGKITPADATIDWRQPAVALARKLRALDPAPGVAARLAGRALKLCAGQVLPAPTSAPAGTIVAAGPDGIDVACGEAGGGQLRVTIVQPAGGRRMPAAAFARGHAVAPGMRFETEG
jgi:methionyl-tRNA formyltransferase